MHRLPVANAYRPFKLAWEGLLLGLIAVALSACSNSEKTVPPEPPAPADKTGANLSIAELEQPAQKGDAEAASELGLRYFQGQDVAKDLPKAAKYFQDAARLGHTHAMFNLAVMYQHGQGVSKDEKESFGWYLKAAELGHADAAKFTGLMYKLGVGTAKDHAQALHWLQKSYEFGNAKAASSIAEIYLKGTAGEVDNAKAREWYLLAARNGDPIAYAHLGMIYSQGLGVAQDEAEAQKWIRLADAAGIGAGIAEAVMADWEKTDPDILHGFALHLEAKGEAGQARAVMERAARAGSPKAAQWLKERP
ncbi:MAG: sel1 repeat family protein [Planctomycetes bacterium]|nr:sel1 repeat family protein [Planctomycetota bacterium]